MRIKLKFIWFDLWVGFFYDVPKKTLYFCPLPCIVFIIQQMKGKEG